MDGVHSVRRESRMGGNPATGGPARQLALVPRRNAHRCRLADQDRGGLEPGFCEFHQHGADADAADLLVIGKRQMKRGGRRRDARPKHRLDRTGDEAFHVGRSASVKAAIVFEEAEGIPRPALAVDGHDVGMPRKHQTAGSRRSDGRKKRCAISGLRRKKPAFDAGLCQQGRDIAHQIDIPVSADRGKGNQPVEDFISARHDRLSPRVRRLPRDSSCGSPASGYPR